MINKKLARLSLLMSAALISGCAHVSSPFSGLSNNNQETWEGLQLTSSAQLARNAAGANDPIKSGWIQLALISKRDSRNTSALVNDLIAWRAQYPSHPGNALLPDSTTLTQLLIQQKPHQVAILLPERGPYSSAGQTVRSGLMKSYYQSGTSQNIKFYDTTSGTSMNDLYQKAIADGADAVIGPLIKADVETLVSAGGFTVQTLALNYTDVLFGSLPTHFYEFGLLPEDDVAQMAARAKHDGGSHAIVIAPQSATGKRMLNAFTAQWKAQGGTIQDAFIYPANTDFNAAIAGLLKINPEEDKKLSQGGANRATLSSQRRQDFDVIIIFSNANDAHVIIPLLRYYYANNIPIFATASIETGDATADMDLDGVTICDIPYSGTDKMAAVGADAYTITQNLPRMQALPSFPLYGQTGALYLNANHQIHRHIPCTRIHHDTN